MVSGGILAAHLEKVYQATVDLLWQRDKKASGEQVILDDLPVPEAYYIRLKMKEDNATTYWQGAWADQPHLLWLEMDETIRAEREVKELKRINAILQQKWNQQHPKG